MLAGERDRRRRAAALPTPCRRARRATTKQTIDQTGDVVEARPDARSLEVLEVLARPEADPADGRTVRGKGDQARRQCVVGLRLEARPVDGLTSLVVPAEAARPPELAPAPGRIAALLEQCGERRPGLAGQRPDVEVHRRNDSPGRCGRYVSSIQDGCARPPNARSVAAGSQDVEIPRSRSGARVPKRDDGPGSTRNLRRSCRSRSGSGSPPGCSCPSSHRSP